MIIYRFKAGIIIAVRIIQVKLFFTMSKLEIPVDHETGMEKWKGFR